MALTCPEFRILHPVVSSMLFLRHLFLLLPLVLTFSRKAEVQACSTPRRVNCKYKGNWTTWTKCSQTCGGGRQTRTREKSQDPKHGGDACVLEEAKFCSLLESSKLPEGETPSLDLCSLVLDGTLTVHLKDFVNKPECLRDNTVIGMKINQERDNDWNEASKQHPNSVVVFTTTENICHPINVTVGLNFWNGKEFVTKLVKSELNPASCDGKKLSGKETKCPNLKALL